MSWTSSRSQCGWSTDFGADRRPHGRADVGQALGLGQPVGDVDPEAVDPELEPEPHGRGELVADLRIGPVEVGLLGREQVQVPLAGAAVGFGHAGPGGPAEVAHPVVRRLAPVGPAPVAEDEPRALGRARRGRQRLLEPGVLVGDVVGNEVEQDAQAERRGPRRSAPRPRPASRTAGRSRGSRRRRSRRPSSATGTRGDPQRVDAERGQVGQPRAQPRRCRRCRRRRRRRSCGCRPGR